MDFSPTPILPFEIGGTVKKNIAVLDDFFFNEKTFSTDLEGFLTTNTGSDQEETWKVVSIIEDDRCITLRFDFDDENATFAGIPIGLGHGANILNTAERLRKRGFEIIVQEYDIVLPEYFITIEPGESLCYWDKNHWTRQEFLEETVEPENWTPLSICSDTTAALEKNHPDKLR